VSPLSSDPADQLQKIGIVGLGLIGGSIGLSLRDPSRELIGCDISPEAQETALSRFCVDRIAALDEVAQAEVIFLAVPPASIVDMAEAVLERRGEWSIVTDCASVKTEIAEWAERKKLRDFLPGHPMAGHEKGGAEYASAWMFRNARWILTPNPYTTKKTISAVEKLVKDMGAVPIQLDASVHDRHVALLSHLPHTIAAILVLMAGDLEHLEVGAGSWRDVTRVGGVDPSLWSQILAGNRFKLAEVLEEFEQSIRAFRGVLEDNDLVALKTILEKAQGAKAEQERRLPQKDSKPQIKRNWRRKS
jgi:prephenate dehydrogenase